MDGRRVVIVLALVVLVSCGGGGGSAGKIADADFKRFDGTSANFTDFRGKPVVVNFFSSTCQPCITEMPALERAHRELGAAVTFLGLDVQDTVNGGKAFVDSVGVTWELGRDPDASILQGVMGGVALPTTVFLDAQSRIVFSHLGKLDEPDQLTQLLRDHHLIP